MKASLHVIFVNLYMYLLTCKLDLKSSIFSNIESLVNKSIYKIVIWVSPLLLLIECSSEHYVVNRIRDSDKLVP